MSDPYNFSKAKRSASEKKAQRPALDLSGIPASLPAPSPDLEAKAIKAGEDLGFVDRNGGVDRYQRADEASVKSAMDLDVAGARLAQSEEPIVRRRPRGGAKQRSIFIKGPAEEIDAFIKFANDHDHASYWAALKDLMDSRGS